MPSLIFTRQKLRIPSQNQSQSKNKSNAEAVAISTYMDDGNVYAKTKYARD